MVPVLFEGPSKKEPGIITGRSPESITVHAPMPAGMHAEALAGTIADVRVEQARTWYLRGTLAASGQV